jgi:peptidoglycan/LPS O-acetylase OafA/YrhL
LYHSELEENTQNGCSFEPPWPDFRCVGPVDLSLSSQLDTPFWTLAIEFQFYLLLPLIAWLLRPMIRRGTVGWRMLKLTFWLLIMAAWGLLTRYWGLFIVNTPKLDFLIPHSISTALIPFIYGDRGKYFEVFAVGMLIGIVYTYTQNSPLAEHWSIRMRRLSPLMFTSGLVLIFFLSIWHFYTVDITSHYTEYHLIIRTPFDSYAPMIIDCWSQWQALIYAIGYGLCLWALLYGSPKLKRPFEWSILRRIGLISFSLYMWHFPFIILFVSIINYHIRQQGLNSLVQYGALWCWVLVVILPISAMLYHWIEQPGMCLGERLIRKLER